MKNFLKNTLYTFPIMIFVSCAAAGTTRQMVNTTKYQICANEPDMLAVYAQSQVSGYNPKNYTVNYNLHINNILVPPATNPSVSPIPRPLTPIAYIQGESCGDFTATSQDFNGSPASYNLQVVSIWGGGTGLNIMFELITNKVINNNIYPASFLYVSSAWLFFQVIYNNGVENKPIYYNSNFSGSFSDYAVSIRPFVESSTYDYRFSVL